MKREHRVISPSSLFIVVRGAGDWYRHDRLRNLQTGLCYNF